MKKLIMSLPLAIAVLSLAGCYEEYRSIPSTWVGKVLAPTGYAKEILTAGQVDLKTSDDNGRQSTLVLLQTGSYTLKEQFLEANADKAKQDNTDHRCVLGDGSVVSVDVYIKVDGPSDPTTQELVFAQVTPRTDEKDSRVAMISIDDVFDRFGGPKIRSQIRLLFTTYPDYKTAVSRFGEINSKIAELVINTFKEDKVPMKVQDVNLSNLKPDPKVFEAQNTALAAQAQAAAIDAIGAAMRRNPQYMSFQRYETYKEIAKGNNGAKPATFVVVDGDPGGSGQRWAAADYAKDK